MSIQLNFINNSNDANNSQIVIFQSDAPIPGANSKIVHKVISNCGPGGNHAFNLPAGVFTIHVAAVHSKANAGQIQAAADTHVTTELSLQGISSADIVMTGGGPGRSASTFTFGLANVK
jgi:hypothetical protein